MTAQLAELLHDEGTGNPHDWQPGRALAEALGVTERTVRNRAGKGAGVERTRGPAGRTYYRATPEPPEPEAAVSEVPTEAAEASVSALRLELVRAHATMTAHLTAAHERERALALELARKAAEASEAERKAAEARLLAEVATRDAERLRGERQRAALVADELAEALEGERARALALERTAADLAAAPWYAWRRRRRALAALAGAPPALALPGPRLHRPATVG